MAEALEPVRGALVARAPVARWGLGYAQGGEILLSRNPRLQKGDVDLYETIQGVRSDCLIAHTSDPDELAGNANTQPFRYRQWMFAQQATTVDMNALDAGLSEHIPEYIRRHSKGKTVAERSFHLFLASAHKAGCVDDADLAPPRAATLVTEGLGVLRDVIARTSADAELGNFILSNGRIFVAGRPAPAGNGPALFLRRLTVPAPRGARDDSFRGVLVVGASAPPGEGFEEIPAGSAVLVTRDVRADVATLEA